MTYELVVVGASWGGLSAASTLLKGLPRGLAAAVVIAQHRGVDVTGGGLAQLLDSRAFMPLKDVEDKEPLERGHIYLAPSDYHVLVERGHLSLSVEGPVSFSRPSIDELF